MSWHFSQALEAAFSEESSLDGGPSAPWSSIPTAPDDSASAKMKDTFHRSPFGTMYAPSTDARGAALLTWYRAASLARTSARPAQATASTVSDPGSGAKWPVWFARFDPATSSWKTPQCSLLGGLESFSGTWPRSGSMRSGTCYPRSSVAPLTFASASGLLPTPTTIDTGSRFNRSQSYGAAMRPTLGAMARFDLWPTPTVHGNYNRKGASEKSGDGLATAVMRWPTPNAGDYRAGMSNAPNREQSSLPRTVGIVEGVSSGRRGGLNPTWVEWLMGWPLRWTASEPLETAKFLEWQRAHGYSLPLNRAA